MTTIPRKKPAPKAATTKPAGTAKKAAPVRPAPKVAPQSIKRPTKPFAKAFSNGTPEKTEKAKKPKVVRDSFTMPKIEYAALDELKQRAIKLAHPIKKGELLRAGIKALTAMPDSAFLQALKGVPSIKTGRPKKS